MWGLEIQLLKQ